MSTLKIAKRFAMNLSKNVRFELMQMNAVTKHLSGENCSPLQAEFFHRKYSLLFELFDHVDWCFFFVRNPVNAVKNNFSPLKTANLTKICRFHRFHRIQR